MPNKFYHNPRLKRYEQLKKDAIRGSKVQFGMGLDERRAIRHLKGDEKVSLLYPRRRAS